MSLDEWHQFSLKLGDKVCSMLISGGSNMVDIYNAQRAARHIYQAYPNYSYKK